MTQAPVKPEMIQVVYVSSTVGLLTQDQIADILIKSRENNERANITGLLLYKGGNVLQLLEGPPEEVERLLAKIERDPRHGGMIRLYQKAIEKRDCGEWTMGFYDLGAEGATYLEGYSDVLTPDFDLRTVSQPTIYRLIQLFRRGVR